MKNFGKVVRLGLRHRWSVVAALASALGVAALWGANIGTVGPFVEVVFQNRSLRGWAEAELSNSRREQQELTARIARLDTELAAPDADRRRLRSQLNIARLRLDAEREAVRRVRWLNESVFVYSPEGVFDTLVLIIGLLVLGTIVKSLFLIANTILVDRLVLLATLDLRKQFYRRTLRLDITTFSEQGTNELLSRFTYDIECITAGLKSLLGKAIREPLKMTACLIGATWICWRLLILSLVIAPLAGFFVQRLARVLKRANRRAMEEMAQVYNVLDETFRGVKAVKAFTMEPAERRRFHLTSKKLYHKGMRIARYNSLPRPVSELMGIATISLALLAGAYLVMEGETHLLGVRMSDRPLSLGALMAFYALLAGVSDPARKLSEVFTRLQRAAAASDRVYELMNREPQVRDPRRATPLARHRQELVFEGVSFHYQPGTPVLEQIDLRIRFGESLAIVGPNGCGKSTLMSLVPRFFDPVSGSVSLDGIDIRQVRLRELRRQIGLVTQEPLLFADSVLGNIRYGSPDATREEVIEAAIQAHAHNFIEQRLEDGYDTPVGPRGDRLSGGQRQRIALARAILRDPAILLLDEATSQIDIKSEQLIHQVLEDFARDRTTVLITHRLATLALADRILVMDSGRILDIGTHDELLGRCQLYARLYDGQLRESA